MERSFVLVLTLVTLVTATPHGYGVKGGASAKAEASAVAGAFGGLGGPLPLSIPSGSSYSGSFSKASSSSFASSSASSSSSSYSFSGSGINGVAGLPNGKGCSTGSCPGAETTGPSSNGFQQLTGANAVSAAQAKALSGSYTPCHGASCTGSPAGKCTSGQCLPDSSSQNQNGCAGNPNCNAQSSETDLSPETSKNKDNDDEHKENKSDSNDFAVNINRNPQSKLSHDSNGQYSNKDKFYNPQSDCSNGKCGSGSSHQSNPDINQNKHPVPSSYLTTPNTDPPCTTPDCHYRPQNSGSQIGGPPSSYNVPIQSATNPPDTYYSSPSGVPCTSPNCNSAPNVGPSNIPSHNYGQQQPINKGPCVSGKCDVASINGETSSGVVPGAKVPHYSSGSIPSNPPSSNLGQPGCKNGYCSGVPAYPSQSTYHPGSSCHGTACGSTSPTTSASKPSDSDAPVYTGGFGGPPGFLDISSGSNKGPGNSGVSHNTPTGSRPSESFGQNPTSFGTTNSHELNSNKNYGNTQSSSNGGPTGGFEYNKPNSGSSKPGSQSNPSTTGSYGVPTASSPVPLSSLPHLENNGNYKPTTSHSTGSGPNYSGAVDGPPGSPHTSSGLNSLHGSLGVTKPNIPSNSLSSPGYTGSFGGPLAPSISSSSPSYNGGYDGFAGSSLTGSGSNSIHGSTEVTKPNTPSNSLSNPEYTSGIGGISGSGSNSGNCGSTDCNSSLNGIVSGNSNHKTNSGTSTSSQNKPTYNGGFGGPNGFLNPNNVISPSNTPTVPSGNNPCVSGNCDSKVTPSVSQGGIQNLASATASANAVVYSGGFGGPPGVLKPYDDGKVNIPAHGNPTDGHSTFSNNGHPNTPSTVNGKNSVPGSSANGANAAAHASATASATAGSYGGGHNTNGASRGCNSGCSPNGDIDGNFGFPGGFGKNTLGAGSLASAKSSAGASAYGNFASSQASAQASAGIATKGGYGRK